jgi:hypothetical protein
MLVYKFGMFIAKFQNLAIPMICDDSIASNLIGWRLKADLHHTAFA